MPPLKRAFGQTLWAIYTMSWQNVNLSAKPAEQVHAKVVGGKQRAACSTSLWACCRSDDSRDGEGGQGEPP